MLKLVSTEQINIESIMEFYNSYDYNSIPSEGKILLTEGVEKFLKEPIDNSETYYLIDTENESYVLGYCKLNDIDCSESHDIGNVSYEVRPNERRKGYGTAMLGLLLEICSNKGQEWVCVSSKKGNEASRKIIESHGGMFEYEFYDELEGEGLKYWIWVTPIFAKRVISGVKTFRKEFDRNR